MQTQVLVAGGGPAGIGAAVAAARRGAEVVLLERYGCLGGMATSGLVNPFMGWRLNGEPLVAGVFQELLEGLADLGAYGGERAPTGFDPEACKLVADRLCQESGATVRLHSLLVGAEVEEGALFRVRSAGKAGNEEWLARVFVDCTGDADLAFLAGVPCEQGRPGDQLTQPMTLNFRMARVEVARMPDREEINRRYDRAKAEGRLSCPRENVLLFHTPQPDVVHFNTTRVVGRNPTEPGDLTAAEMEARRQAHELAQFLRSDVPGFEQAYLQQTAATIGVRESRRIRGQYHFTGEDVEQGRKFPDGIARSNYPIDIHNPAGSGTVIRQVPAGDYYEVPYRSLLPLGVDRLLVAGRSVASTHEGQSALRIMPTCFAMGEAAGVAAAMAAERGISPREVDPEDLRRALREQGQLV